MIQKVKVMVDFNEVHIGDVVYAGPDNKTPCEVIDLMTDKKRLLCVMCTDNAMLNRVPIVLSPEECFWIL